MKLNINEEKSIIPRNDKQESSRPISSKLKGERRKNPRRIMLIPGSSINFLLNKLPAKTKIIKMLALIIEAEKSAIAE